MLATELGIWATNTLLEDETEWAPASEGMANVRVDMLQLREADNTVLAASHGRGLFTTTYEIDVYTGEKEQILTQADFSVYPNPASDFATISFTSEKEQNVTLLLTDINGRIISQKNLVSQVGIFIDRLDLSACSEGVYLLTLQFDDRKFSKKILVR